MGESAVGLAKKAGALGSILLIVHKAAEAAQVSVTRTWKSVLYDKRKWWDRRR